MSIKALEGWTTEQKHVVAATFLGWTLDAFDFFLMVFVLKDIAQEFQTDITADRGKGRDARHDRGASSRGREELDSMR